MEAHINYVLRTLALSSQHGRQSITGSIRTYFPNVVYCGFTLVQIFNANSRYACWTYLNIGPVKIILTANLLLTIFYFRFVLSHGTSI